MNELCLANLTIGDAGPLELIDAASAAGFHSINLWLAPPPAMAAFAGKPREPHDLIGNENLVRATRTKLDATGVSVFAGSCGWLDASFDPRTIARAFDTLEALGARNVALVGWDADRARLTRNLATVARAAGDRGFGVNFEFMSYSAVRTIEEAAALLNTLPANVRLIIDALHLARSGGTPAAVTAVPAERIASLQLCDASREAPAPDRLRDESVNDRSLPGDGALPLRALLDALPAGVVIEVEAPVRASAMLPATERAIRAAERTRTFLATAAVAG